MTRRTVLKYRTTTLNDSESLRRILSTMNQSVIPSRLFLFVLFPFVFIWLLVDLLTAKNELIQNPFSSGGELVVNVIHSCPILVLGTKHQKITVSNEQSSPVLPSDWTWTIQDEQAVLTIQKRMNKGHIKISVPTDIRLTIESRAGNIDINNLQGCVVVKLQVGNIVLRKLNGVIDVWTQHGDLLVEKCSAIGRVTCNNGLISILGFNPNLFAKVGKYGSIVNLTSDSYSSSLISLGTDLFIDNIEKQEFSDIKLDRGSLTINTVNASTNIEVIHGKIIINNLPEKIDLGLKLKNSLAKIFDPTKKIGQLMLLQKDDHDHSFLNISDKWISNFHNGPIIQINKSQGFSRLKAEFEDSVLSINDSHKMNLTRRKE